MTPFEKLIIIFLAFELINQKRYWHLALFVAGLFWIGGIGTAEAESVADAIYYL